MENVLNPPQNPVIINNFWYSVITDLENEPISSPMIRQLMRLAPSVANGKVPDL